MKNKLSNLLFGNWCKYYFSYLTLFMTFHFALCHECPLLSSG